MSRLPTASTSAAPMPGYWKTDSTTTTPPAIHASCSAVTWIAGTIAFGTAWRQITCLSGRPLSRAIVTYSLSSTSIVEPRMMRLMYGTTARISVAAGSTTTCGSSHAFSPGASSETAGKMWNRPVAKMRTRQIPMTNSGSAARTSVTVEVTLSTARSRFIAIHTPSTIDSGIAMIDATKTRNAEFATRSDRICVTGCCVAAELPKSKVRIPFSHCVYCVTTDSLRCSCSRRAATRSGVAVLPRIAVAASPGSAITAAKTTSDTSHRVRIPRPMRRRSCLDDTAVLRAVGARAGGWHGGRVSFGVGELRGDQVPRASQVVGHELGRGGVALLDGLEQVGVVGHVARPGVLGVVAQEHLALGRQRVVGTDEARAAGEADELLVEADVRVDDGLGHAVVVARRLRQVVERRPEVAEVLGRRVEDPPRRRRLDRLARDVDVEAVGERHHPDVRAAMGLVLDEPLLDELSDRLADRAAAGAERAGERHLAQRLALRDATLDDRLAQLAQDLLGHGRPLDARETPGVRQGRHWSPPVDCRQPYDFGLSRVKGAVSRSFGLGSRRLWPRVLSRPGTPPRGPARPIAPPAGDACAAHDP